MEKLVAWVEIPAIDFNRAVSFYEKVFSLNLDAIDCGEEKMACFPTGEGAISLAPGFKPSKDGLLVSFNTGKNLDSVLELIEVNNGQILQPKTKIEAEGRGYFATFIDCEGNRVGLYGD